MYIGESISLIVAISWTFTALFAEVASKRCGALPLNVIRMILSLVLLSATLWIFTGSPFPMYADTAAWIWLSLSGFVGYVFGDYCLFNSYILIGSRLGQLFMTLAPIAAAFTGWFLLGEHMTNLAVLGMLVTVFGIGFSILGKSDDEQQKHFSVKLPLKGILFGIGAGVGQGVGLVLSKIGLENYALSIPEGMDSVVQLMPFSATYIRAITGLIGFTIFLHIRKEWPGLKQATQNKIGLKYALGATILGPFIGVSLSLMATQYTATGIAQTIMSTTPVFIIWPSYLMFHQRVTIREVIGASISVVGVSLFFI